jgi:hypothetical protein
MVKSWQSHSTCRALHTAALGVTARYDTTRNVGCTSGRSGKHLYRGVG